MKIRILVVSLFIILLFGCNTPNSSPILIPTQELTPFRLPPTWTPTITITPQASATSIVFETLTAVPPITSLPLHTQTANPDVLWANYIPLPSPNGEWIAYFNIREIKVVHAATSKLWTLPCELFERCQYILPVKWSHNSDILFFGASSYLGGVPQATTISFFSTAGKINVKTGQWERLFPDPPGYFDFSISSNDAYLAYTQSVKAEQSDSLSVKLTVSNLNNHLEESYMLTEGFGGNIVWSPYRNRFIFQTYDSSKGSSLVYFDADNKALRYIVKEKKSDFSIRAWLEDNVVLIQEIDWENQNSSLWHLNPSTNEFLVASTATPTP